MKHGIPSFSIRHLTISVLKNSMKKSIFRQSGDFESTFDDFLEEDETDSVMSIEGQPVILTLANAVDITDNSYPFGFYRATVKVVIEAGGEA